MSRTSLATNPQPEKHQFPWQGNRKGGEKEKGRIRIGEKVGEEKE